MKKAKDTDAAWDVQERYEGQAHGWIQWKGTNVCLDLHCACGNLSHVDGAFAYNVKCPECGRVYFCNGHIELIELEQEPTSGVVIASNEDDDSCDDGLCYRVECQRCNPDGKEYPAEWGGYTMPLNTTINFSTKWQGDYLGEIMELRTAFDGKNLIVTKVTSTTLTMTNDSLAARIRHVWLVKVWRGFKRIIQRLKEVGVAWTPR
jgi:hypothetical protein